MKKILSVLVVLACVIAHTFSLAEIEKIEGQTIDAVPTVDYEYNETFEGYSTCIDGAFTQLNGVGTIVDDACNYTIGSVADQYQLLYTFGAGVQEFDSQIVWKTDSTMFSSTAGQTEVLRFRAGSLSVCRVVLWAANPCSPCTPGRLRVEVRSDSGVSWASPDLQNITIVAGTSYNIRMYYKIDRTAASSGILKVWIDDVLLIDLNNVDNNDVVADIDSTWTHVASGANQDTGQVLTVESAWGYVGLHP